MLATERQDAAPTHSERPRSRERCRDGEASGVASDAADCELL